MTNGMNSFLPVDAHVHFHRLQRVPLTLEAAAKNFSSLGASNRPFIGMLLLAQANHEHVFERLVECPPQGDWQFQSVSAEKQTVIATSANHRIALVCGRQIRCARGIEVLALGTLQRFPEDRQPEDIVDRVTSAGAIPVLPWGFGKWIGSAGTKVTEIFARRAPGTIFAGDNGGRLAIFGMPKYLKELSRRGTVILPGSDPFPFGKDYRRVGAFGFLASRVVNEDQPWTALRSWLQTPAASPEPYGRALGPSRFLINQSGIQIRKRLMRIGRA